MTLTEAIVVRMSHDLAGAVGAVANTLDLIKMDASFMGDSIELLETSSQQLTARLNFVRALFGAETKSINKALVDRYLATLAIKVDFKGNPSSRNHLALIAVGLELLGVEGSLNLVQNKLTIQGNNLHHDPMYFQALMGTAVPCEPKLVMALWLHEVARQSNLSVQIDADEEKITLSIA